MLESARERFARSPAAKEHAKYVDSASFAAAADAALLSLLTVLPESKENPVVAAASFQQLKGAAEALRQFKGLCDQQTVPARSALSPNLDHNA